MTNNAEPASVSAPRRFGALAGGETVELVELAGAGGARLRVMTLGAAIQHLSVPDREGRLGNVVLSYDELAPYVARPEYFGASMGRFANRIGGAAFTLDGVRYALEANEGANILHGGDQGFDKKLWRIEETGVAPAPFVRLHYHSADGEAGFPGALDAHVTYALGPDNALTVSFTATCDKPTVANFTNHSFFNLAGAGDILGHELVIDADAYTPVDAGLIPTGEIRDLAGGPLDFREANTIGARIAQTDIGGGYDHNYAMRQGRTAAPKRAARLHDPASGRVLELFTTEPGLQFYSGQKLGTGQAATPALFGPHRGLALEPQAFPDAPNNPQFASARLDPGQTYRHVAIYRFTTA